MMDFSRGYTWGMLERLVTLAQEAGDVAMVHYQTDTEVRLKADRSPVTAADLAAQQVIVDGLRSWEASIPIIAEEGPLPAEFDLNRKFWLVDPLDGTKEFLNGNGEFTVNIALIDQGEPVLGVVHAPALGVLYFAGQALHSWCCRGAADPERIYSSAPANDEALIVAESRSHPSAVLEAYLSRFRVARRIRIGSSLKFCLVAEGSAHIYPRLGPTMAWDVAAGDCVFRNSGRMSPRFSPLTYGSADFRNGPFVVGFESDTASAAL